MVRHRQSRALRAVLGRGLDALALCGALAHAVTGIDAVAADPPTVTFGARIDARPLSFRTEGVFRGYTIDICEAVKAKLVEIDPSIQVAEGYVAVTAGDRLAKLRDGEIDILCGAFTQNVTRMKEFDFSYLIFISGTSVVSKRPASTGVLGQEDVLSKPGVRVVVVSETTTDAFVSKKLAVDAKVVRADTHSDAWQELAEGKVDLYYGDRVILRERIRQSGQPDDYVLDRRFLTYEPYALPMRKDGPPRLFDAANQAIVELFRTEEIIAIYERHFGAETDRSGLLDALYDLYAIPE